MLKLKEISHFLKQNTSREAIEELSAMKDQVGWVEISPDGNVMTVNDMFLSMIGYSSEEIVGFHHSMMCSTKHIRNLSSAEFWENLENGGLVSGIFEFIKKDGETVYLNGFYLPIIDHMGKLSKIINTVTDITDSHEDLKNNEDIISSINKSMAIIEFTIDGKIIDANANFLKLMKYNIEDIIGKHHKIFCYDDFYDKNPDFWKKIKSGDHFTGRFERHDSSGSRLWLEASYNPVKNSHGVIYKVIKIASDITSRVEAARRIADIAVTTSEETSQITYNANDVLSETVRNSLIINEQVESASEIGKKLFHSADNIKEIISTISNITDQTNILALNAAIEAARAGESGRGFAVVAGEVRRLAGSTSSATKKITDVIEENNRLINDMYHQLNEVKKIISSEHEKIADLSRSFMEINSGVNEFSKVIHQLNT